VENSIIQEIKIVFCTTGKKCKNNHCPPKYSKTEAVFPNARAFVRPGFDDKE